VGYDPDFARSEMEAAGYPNCEGFPAITMTSYTGDATRNRIEFFQAAIEEELGCSADVIRLEQLPFRELLAAYDVAVPDSDAPHMWTGAWGPDYADENNWVGDVLWCDSATPTKRACSEVDELILEARNEQDQSRRVELYREIEEGLFGSEGEMPIMPVLLRLNFQAVHSWYDFVPALFGGSQFYNYSIDVDAMNAAME
jgi:ABC-type transport system substrate-binding protein